VSKVRKPFNVHYVPAVKELTMELWLSGKSHEEISNAIRKYMANFRRNRRKVA